MSFKLLSRERVTHRWLTLEDTLVPSKSRNIPTARNEHSFHSQQPRLDPQVSQHSLMVIPVSQLQEHTREEVSWFCRVLLCASSSLWWHTTFQLFQKTHPWVWISARTPSCGHPSIQMSLKSPESKPNHHSSALFTKGGEEVMCCALGGPTGQSLLGFPAGSRKPGGSHTPVLEFISVVWLSLTASIL